MFVHFYSRMRVALVVLDTLREDTFDKHFKWIPGLRFTSAYSVSHWTLPAHASLFTGVYPSEHGTHSVSKSFDFSSDVLSERLRSAGYTTRAFSANMFISPAFGFARGFTEFEGSLRVKPTLPEYFNWTGYGSASEFELLNYAIALRDMFLSDVSTIRSLRAAVANRLMNKGIWTPTHSGSEDAIRWARDTDYTEDEFLFVNLGEVHTPYHYIPDSYKSNMGFTTHASEITGEMDHETQLKTREQYANAASYLSNQYQRLFESLRQEMDYVVTVADHGESLGEGGRWEHDSGLWPELTNIPLVISGETIDDGTVDTPVNLLDVHRTISDICGVVASGRGRNLIDLGATRPLLQETFRVVLNDTELDTPEDRTTISSYRGIITENGEHVFETGGNLVGSDGVENAEDRLFDTVEQLDLREPTTHERNNMSTHVEQQLEHLGYR